MPTPAGRGPGRPWRLGTPPPGPIDPDLPSADLRIGYARCSTLGQELDSQLDALSKHGIPRDKIFSEKISTRVRVPPVRGGAEDGARGPRPRGVARRRAASAGCRDGRPRARAGSSITSARIEQARRLAVSVRPQVNWIQGARHDQLSWVLLDMVAMDWAEPKIVLWLNQLGHEAGTRRWRPRFPHRLIAAALLRKERTDKERTDNEGHDHDQALRHSVAPNHAFAQAFRDVAARHGGRCTNTHSSLRCWRVQTSGFCCEKR